MRLTRSQDLATIVALTEAAYAPYNAILDALYTNSKLERNIALYPAYGYRETGRRPNPYRPGWVLVDMAKALEETTSA